MNSEIINIHTCTDNCCVFKITPYKPIKWSSTDGWKQSSNRVTKAGSFIMNPTKDAMEKNLYQVFKNKVQLVFSNLKESDAAILGASALVFHS